MSYILKLNSPDDLSPTQAKAAEKIYRKHLDEQIGDASLVWPVYQAYLKIVAIYGLFQQYIRKTGMNQTKKYPGNLPGIF